MQSFPEPVVGTFIINADNKILLIKSHKWTDHYVVPGGHIELGEKIEDTLKRELKEETGLTMYDYKFLCFWEFINGEEFHKKKHMIFLNYMVRTKDNKITLNDEGQEYVWVNLRDSLKLNLTKHVRLTIEKYILQK